MRRTNVADEFTRLQRESQEAMQLLGKAMAEPGTKRIDQRRFPQFALVVQPRPVITDSRKSG
jgi:hypothetical protein